MRSNHPNNTVRSETAFLGLAPFLRMSIAGTDLSPVAKDMLARATDSDDANLWMNLSTVMLCLRQRDIGLAIQEQALALRRTYHLAASRQPAQLRVLMLMVPGDLSANTPLDCLLENSDVDLDFYFVSPGVPLALPIPEHDVLVVGMGESEADRELLETLKQDLAAWPKPVINAPQNIPNTGRDTASKILQNVPGLLIPPTLRASRQALQAIATRVKRIPELFDSCDFPIILRPVGSQGGVDLDKIDGPEILAGYLSRVDEPEFFLSRFIDYSGMDGLFRKMRIALIDGVPFVCHMAVSSNWMVHYVNAGMYEDASKREEEASFMAHFDDFIQRHRLALDAIFERTRLDYLCIDCAETRNGQMLIFEVDHVMVVHAMDPEDQFPYKQRHMQKLKDAFRAFLLSQAANHLSNIPARTGLTK